MLSNREDLSALAIFVAVAGHRSFRRAAAELGVSPSALSHALRDLETRLGQRLLHRTTRSVRPTEAGERLLRRLRPTFRDISAALSELNLSPEAPTQRLRLSATPAAADLVLAPLLGQLTHDHPQLRLEVVTAANPAAVDGCDAILHEAGRSVPERTSLPIGPRQRWVVVGAPAYFATRAQPQTLRDLRQHICIRHRGEGGVVRRWGFARDGVAHDIDVEGPLTLNDQDVMLQAASDGAGLAYVLDAKAETLVTSGRLVRVLEDWCPEQTVFSLVYPTEHGISPALRLVIEAAHRQFL